jgi:energy-coupling factor transporter ATP-binding protein EcfA2
LTNYTLKCRNFLGVTKADVPLGNEITLVGGHNASGKSSLLDAVSCCLAGSTTVRGISTKKGAAVALKDGSQAGSITLEYPGGAVRIVYPAGEFDQTGKPMEIGSALAVGAVRFMALKEAERLQEVTRRFEASPSLDDMKTWFAEHETVHPKPDAKAIEGLWNRVDEQGWDAVAKAANEHSTKLKGRWEQIAERRWGVAVVKTWLPSPLLEGETYDIEAEREALAQMKAALDKAIAGAAVGEAQIATLRDKAGRIATYRNDIRVIEEDKRALELQAERLTEERAPHDLVAQGPNHLRCPACAAWLNYIPGRVPKLEGIKQHPTPTEVEIALRELKRIDGDRDKVLGQIRAKAAEIVKLQHQIADAEVAQADLDRALQRGAGTIGQDDVEAAREAALAQERKIAAITRWHDAHKVAVAWQSHQVVLDALAPAGVRAAVLQRRMSEINALLSEISTEAKFGEVALTDNMEATYDKRPYALLSESERWRVDFALAVLFNRQERAGLLLVDRLDVLHPGARPAVLMLLKGLTKPVLVACTAKDRAALPDLQKAKVGKVLWLTGGVLEAA